MRVREAALPEDLPAVGRLFVEYVDGLGIDLGFQDFDGELAGLPGRYAPPAGGLWLAWVDDEPVGCIGLRPLDGDRCELKRLYLRPDHRGGGLGRALVDAALRRADEAGHARVVLDTLPSMVGALALYRSMGFAEIDAYNDNPVPGVLFLERRLRPRASAS